MLTCEHSWRCAWAVPYLLQFCTIGWLAGTCMQKSTVYMIKINPNAKSKSHLGGLEPPTFWLTAKRANPLRHRCYHAQLRYSSICWSITTNYFSTFIACNQKYIVMFSDRTCKLPTRMCVRACVCVCISESDWYSANCFFGRISLMLTYFLLWARILAVTSHATAAAVTAAHC